MAINNFEKIKGFFYFNEANNMFFHCQIVQRAKDHKGEKVREGAIKTYFIRSREHLERVMPEIVLLCEHYKARAYINVAGKDFDALQKLMLVKLASDIHQGLIRNPRKCLNSAAGELKSRNPKWIVDIDNPEDEKLVIDWLRPMWTSDFDYYVRRVPTKSCCHLITPKFNLMEFHKKFPEIDVHKNSMGTMLYCPDIEPVLKCSVCGGTHVQTQAWVNPNHNNQYVSDIEGRCWCEDCEQEVKLTT